MPPCDPYGETGCRLEGAPLRLPVASGTEGRPGAPTVLLRRDGLFLDGQPLAIAATDGLRHLQPPHALVGPDLAALRQGLEAAAARLPEDPVRLDPLGPGRVLNLALDRAALARDVGAVLLAAGAAQYGDVQLVVAPAAGGLADRAVRLWQRRRVELSAARAQAIAGPKGLRPWPRYPVVIAADGYTLGQLREPALAGHLSVAAPPLHIARDARGELDAWALGLAVARVGERLPADTVVTLALGPDRPAAELVTTAAALLHQTEGAAPARHLAVEEVGASTLAWLRRPFHMLERSACAPPAPDDEAPAEPAASAGQVSVEILGPHRNLVGAIPKETVTAVLRAARERLRRCAQHGPPSDPEIRGRALFEQVIEPSGRVSHVDLIEAEIAYPAVLACLRELLCQLRYPPRPAGAAIVAFPFELKQSPNAPP